MKEKIKRLLEARAPVLLDVYRSINNRRLFGLRFRSLHKRALDQFFKGSHIEVLTGPFKGLKYFNSIVWGPITPKWLGSYECELHAIIEEIVVHKYEVIIDVGCAEGYYAVGLAYRSPGSHVFAYDVDFISRRQTRRLVRINGLGRQVSVCRYCSSSDIERHVSRNTLVVCDIEGFERSLLDPASCPALSRIDILVEVHEWTWHPKTLDLLISRFSATHDIQEIDATGREDWIQTAIKDSRLAAPGELLREAVNEHRSNGRKWLWMKTKNRSNHETSVAN
jgi:hypothetical protein